jgi:ABC-type molybdate transport system substrate-binding protein
MFSAACASAAQPDSNAIEMAGKAAQSWLALVDSQQYAATWEQAAKPFQMAISKPDWETAVATARAPLGQLEQRVLISASYTEELPGAPRGQYVVIQYKTQFSKKQAAVETITPVKDADGTWRVTGYFIK